MSYMDTVEKVAEVYKEAAELTSKQRNSLSAGDFVFPEERRYPIPDEAHARNALARVAQFGTPAEKERVRSAVHAKFPGIDKESSALPAKVAEVVEIYKEAVNLAPVGSAIKNVAETAGKHVGSAIGAGSEALAHHAPTFSMQHAPTIGKAVNWATAHPGAVGGVALGAGAAGLAGGGAVLGRATAPRR